jgi:glycosyltransferase involved in cell wall biosynthesis
MGVLLTERGALKALATALEIEDSVSLPGSSSDPLPLVAGAAALVLPSRRGALPLVLLEALALGTPIIAAAERSGVREVLGNGAYGELVPIEPPSAIAASRRAAHVSHYDVARTVDGYRPVFRELATWSSQT